MITTDTIQTTVGFYRDDLSYVEHEVVLLQLNPRDYPNCPEDYPMYMCFIESTPYIAMPWELSDGYSIIPMTAENKPQHLLKEEDFDWEHDYGYDDYVDSLSQTI